MLKDIGIYDQFETEIRTAQFIFEIENTLPGEQKQLEV